MSRTYRNWLKLVDEFPDLRWNLEFKLDYFIVSRISI